MQEYPKYVTPDESFVVRHEGKVVNVPHWPHFHVDREGAVTVLVNNAEEEGRAVSAPPAPPVTAPLAYPEGEPGTPPAVVANDDGKGADVH